MNTKVSELPGGDLNVLYSFLLPQSLLECDPVVKIVPYFLGVQADDLYTEDFSIMD